MLNLVDERKPIGVLFSDENLKAGHVHDLSPKDEARRMANLRRIFGGQQEAGKKQEKS